MPLTPPGLSGALIPSLAASLMLGPAMPQLAQGVANGTVFWASQAATVTSVDTGTLGVGASFVPLIVPPPLLLANLLIAFTANGMLGPMAPLEATGLSIGLSLGLAQALLVGIHPTVGLGAGVAKITGTAIPSMIAGFVSAGMKGPSAVQQATAIGMALDLTFAAFVLPIPIVGPPSIVPSAGVGTGKIV